MSTQRVFKILTAKDVAVASATTSTIANITDGNVVAFRNDWTQLLAADTIAESPSIFIVQKITNSASSQIGSLASLEIIGLKVRSYSGKKFRPESSQITYVGLYPASSPKTLSGGSGSIVANSNLPYTISIIDKSVKEIRQVPKRYSYDSTASATQLAIATNLTNKINADTSQTICAARVIGNGTGTDGLTSATAWGIQLKGTDGTHWFEVGLSDAWENTPVTYDIANYEGTNTTVKLQDLEQLAQGYEGYFNRYLFSSASVPLTSYIATQSASTVTNSGGTVALTQNSCTITFSAAVATELIAGDAIYISGVRYVIATKTSSTVYVLSEPYRGSTNAALTVATGVTKEEGYDSITIEHDSFYQRPSTDGNAERPETTIILIPSYLAQSTALSVLKTCLDAWMTSLPAKFASCGL